MAKKDNTSPGVQCENADMEMLRRKLIQIERLLTDNYTEQKELIDRIPTTPMLIPPAEPQPIVMPEINIPTDIAKQSDINTLVKMVVALNTSVEQEVKALSELKKMLEEQNKDVIRVLQESGKISDETIDAIAKRLAEGYKPDVNDAIIQGVIEGKLKSPGISLTNAESIHSDIMEIKREISVRDQCDKVRKENKWLWIACIVLLHLLFVAGFWIKRLYSTQETLVRTEWLYRWKRTTQPDTQDFQFFENTVLNGSKEQRHEIYRKIIEMEKTTPEFRYFHPHDDWKPKETANDTIASVQQHQTKESELLPHQRKSRLTPGEIQAIKDCRADPNIPEDAKPPLPEGYED